MRKCLKNIATLGLAFVGLSAFSAHAVMIDNDLVTGQLGFLAIDVDDAGESNTVYISGRGTPSNTFFEETSIVYEYLTYIDTGTGGDLLSDFVDSGVSLSGDDQATSSGSFAGSDGNTINWTAVSSIPNDGQRMTTTFTFTAQTGTLGVIRLYQYLDEDVLDSDDDVFFTRGSAAGGDLALYTIDDEEAIGISHAGAYNSGQGLQNSSFVGYAACEYDDMVPAIEAETQPVSPTGALCSIIEDEAINHPVVGASYGPLDVVSVLRWDVSPAATTATIITTLGGVPDITDVVPRPPSAAPVPVPTLSRAALALLGMLIVLLVAFRRYRLQ